MLAALIPLLLFPVADPDVPLPGGTCDGLVDVLCADMATSCDPGPTHCEEVWVRDCVVWITYLDMTSPPGWESLSPTVCEDQPYYP